MPLLFLFHDQKAKSWHHPSHSHLLISHTEQAIASPSKITIQILFHLCVLPANPSSGSAFWLTLMWTLPPPCGPLNHILTQEQMIPGWQSADVYLLSVYCDILCTSWTVPIVLKHQSSTIPVAWRPISSSAWRLRGFQISHCPHNFRDNSSTSCRSVVLPCQLTTSIHMLIHHCSVASPVLNKGYIPPTCIKTEPALSGVSKL